MRKHPKYSYVKWDIPGLSGIKWDKSGISQNNQGTSFASFIGLNVAKSEYYPNV